MSSFVKAILSNMRFRVCSIYLYGYPELTLVRDLRTDVVSGIVGTETARGVWEVG